MFVNESQLLHVYKPETQYLIRPLSHTTPPQVSEAKQCMRMSHSCVIIHSVIALTQNVTSTSHFTHLANQPYVCMCVHVFVATNHPSKSSGSS